MNGSIAVRARADQRASDWLTPFRSWVVRCGTVLLGLACSAVAFAADDAKIIYPKGSGTPAAPAASGAGLANTLTLVVAVVIAAIGGWIFWRNRRNPGVGRDNRALAVEETRSLGNRQYLVVASYEGKKFLLGVCPGRIDMLAPLNERREGDVSR